VPTKIGKSHFCLDENDFVELCVDTLRRISASKPLFPFLKRAIFKVGDPKDPSPLYSLIISAQAPEPVEEIISAAAHDKVRVLACNVMTRRQGPRTLPVMFADDQPVNQIVPGPIGLSLQLDIGEVTLVQQFTANTGDQDAETHPDGNGSTYHG
jgi:hypothetical protein